MNQRKRTDAPIAFSALAIEGGLLSPEWLAKAAQLTAGHQGEADYRIPRGLALRDEIGRYWRIAQAHWADFAAARDRLGADERRGREASERFVVPLLREVFGFQTLHPCEPVLVGDRAYPIGHAALGGRAPVVVAPAGLGVDTATALLGDGGRRRSAFGLCQEHLNAAEGALWGLATDGVCLRVVRDNASLTRPAWVEADLGRIFAEELYADFAALWLLIHETRFGSPEHPVQDCPLERWREAGREQGTRAREKLRQGVEEALVALGTGFLAHPENGALRAALQAPPTEGGITAADLYQELLRVVYRLIFLLTVEERGLLHKDGAAEGPRRLYADGYSVARLRARALRRSAHDRFHDLWEAQKLVFRCLAGGEERLALPALGGLFATGQCPRLDAARLENRAFLLAVFRLSWLREDTGLARVNWRDMGPEELGSVYESLLELVPQVSVGKRTFQFASGAETRGNARKTSGSYYTPDSLVQVLLDSALEPVVRETIAAHPGREGDALLELSVVDPACGSGHFLLSAARRLGAHVARLRSGGTPSAAEYRRAVRQVVGRCVYGVDLNPMAVELCKVALWMEAVEPGMPLTFLDAHVQLGNSLLGTTPELMAQGIPDAAWKPIEGDDKATARGLEKRNRAVEKGQLGLEVHWGAGGSKDLDGLRAAADAFEQEADADVEGVSRKEARWREIGESEAYRRQRLAADAWCAAFVWPKVPGEQAEVAPTNGLWADVRDGRGTAPALLVETTEALRERYRFFHWHLQFPRVFARGGFDVVLGNPPWERVKLQEQEFFAARDDAIAGAANAAARKKRIAALPETDPALWREWCEASREAQGQSHFVRQSGRYPLCGRGDVNTYALFAEHNRGVLGARGRAGFIVPTGIATDEGTSTYLGALVEARELQGIVSYENFGTTFGGVNNRQSFCLFMVSRAPVSASRLLFHVNQPLPPNAGPLDFELGPDDFAVFNPNTLSCPKFRTRRDAGINLAMYRRAGVLWREDSPDGNPWGIRFLRMFDMAGDSGQFRTAAQLQTAGLLRNGAAWDGPGGLHLPLYEAKMVHLLDHRYSTYEGATQANLNKGTLPQVDDARHADPSFLSTPEYWVSATAVEERLRDRWERGWLLGWRDICRSTDVRTVVAAVVPRVAVGDKFLLMLPHRDADTLASLVANLTSISLDFAARGKVGGASLKYFTMRQLPVLPPPIYDAPAPWSPPHRVGDWLLPRVLELTYTAWDLEPFARDVGWDGPPFRWDPARRALLRADLDAAFFHLYGLSRDDTDYVLDTFPVVRKNDEKAHGEYRTKRLILEAWDAMAEAARTGRPYETPLDPPPADPGLAHPPRPQDRP